MNVNSLLDDDEPVTVQRKMKPPIRKNDDNKSVTSNADFKKSNVIEDSVPVPPKRA